MHGRACGDVTIGAVFGAITYLQALFIVAAAATAAGTVCYVTFGE